MGRRDHGAAARAMAPRPWRWHQRGGGWVTRYRSGGSRFPTGEPRRSELPELPDRYSVPLDLEVQGLVVHAEQPRRLALVAPRGLKGQADRLPLRFRGGPASDVPEGEARRFAWSGRPHHGVDPPWQFADQCGRLTTVRTAGTALRRCRTASS